MKEFNNDLSSVFVDIDDTITMDFGKTVVENSIETLKKLSETVNIYIWSQGGVPYANEIVYKYGLSDFICAVIPKPDLIIDDLKFDQWCNHIKPTWEHINKLSDSLSGCWVEDSQTLKQYKGTSDYNSETLI